MAFVSDTFYFSKLKKYNINIKTKYIVDKKILERNTDGSVNDEINKGIICEKDYYYKNELKHVEKDFDSRMEYSFISKEEENKEHTCPNCGMRGKLLNFLDGCPYCQTYYNIDYTDKELGNKYHYDLALRSNLYRIITAIVDLVVSIILAFIFIKTTSRTFNSYDIGKVFIYGFILSLILYYFFYVVDAYIVLGPIKSYKNSLNQKQIEFWKNSGIDKKNFFNNFNYELRKYYYSIENVVDYDILDYISFNEYSNNGKRYVDVVIFSRIVYFNNGKISFKYVKSKFTLMKNINETLKLNDGANVIKCVNCGASVDVNNGSCEYCGTEIKYLQEWILVNNM